MHIKFLSPICNEPPSDLAVADGGEMLSKLWAGRYSTHVMGETDTDRKETSCAPEGEPAQTADGDIFKLQKCE